MKSDTLFTFYKNTNFNIVPLIGEKEKKVYLLTAPLESGVLLLGNDYLLTFDKNNKLTSKTKIHKSLIIIDYKNQSTKAGEDNAIMSAMHSHVPGTSDFITATDICTLMLYARLTKIPTHHVVTQKYLSIWDGEKNELSIVPMDLVRKINKDQEKGKKQKEER